VSQHFRIAAAAADMSHPISTNKVSISLKQTKTAITPVNNIDIGGRRNGDESPLQQQRFGYKQRRCHDGGQDMRLMESS
jgi:hypothetical protein